MLSKKITDGTEFVVFDMEWNQPLPGKEYPFDVSRLTGEIIEIGAFKYVYDNGELIYKSSFSKDIAPVKYTKLHYHVKKVTHKKNADLLNGIPFKDAYLAFRDFCGNAILVGWGSSDPSMLKMNLEFFEIDVDFAVKFQVDCRFRMGAVHDCRLIFVNQSEEGLLLLSMKSFC